MAISVLYARGLQGEFQISGNYALPTHRTYAQTVDNAATNAGAEFHQIDYQTTEKPFPTVAEIGTTMAVAIKEQQDLHNTTILVGSGVGGGAWLEGYGQHLLNGGEPVAATVLIQPVYDMAASIEAQGQNSAFQKHWQDSLEKGSSFPVFVTRADGQDNPGYYHYPARGLGNAGQLRLLSEADIEGSTAQTVIKMMRLSGTHFTIIAAENDSMSPITDADKFVEAIGWGRADLIPVYGTHNENTKDRYWTVSELTYRAVKTATPALPHLSRARSPLQTLIV